jgi:uncharacterized protein (TIGR03118 family)
MKGLRQLVALTISATVLSGLAYALLGAGTAFSYVIGDTPHGYVQTNLVSDGAAKAKTTDSNLKNPWGLTFLPGTPFWVADNNAFVSTLYDGTGKPISLVVNIPLPNAAKGGSPSGLVGNIFAAKTNEFITPTTGEPSLFIFDTEDGTVVAWNLSAGSNAQLAFDNSKAGAVYKGLAIGTSSSGDVLYAANFNSGKVDVFDSSFKPVTLKGTFTDPNLPKGYAPFGIQSVNGNLYVTYAVQDKAKHDPVNKAGNGIVNVFDLDGILISRFVTKGKLDSPWGVVLAPSSFGEFANDILVGNFGNGRINAYDSKGNFLGTLTNLKKKPLVNGSLWALEFGGGALNASANTLYFTAGLHKEMHGLFGTITAQ